MVFHIVQIREESGTTKRFSNRLVFRKTGSRKAGRIFLDACAAIKENVPDVIPFWCNSGVATGEATSMQTYEMLLYGTGEKTVR